MSTSDKNPLFNLIPESVDNAVKNLSDLPTKGIGQTFSDIWYLIIGGPMHHLFDKRNLKYAHCLELYQNELTASITQIPPEMSIEPDFQTVSIALENSKYCVEKEELRKLFVELITSSMRSDKANLVHPSFSEIIKQLQPIDAIMFDTHYKLGSRSHIPLVCPTIAIVGKGQYFPSATPKWFGEICSESFDMFDCSASLENLNRLGLIELMYDRNISAEGGYDQIRNHPSLIRALEKSRVSFPQYQLDLDFTECVGRITDFGLNFGQACLPRTEFLRR